MNIDILRTLSYGMYAIGVEGETPADRLHRQYRLPGDGFAGRGGRQRPS